MEYLVMSRGDDEPHTYIMSEKQLRQHLDESKYSFLDKPPEFDRFPSNSVFIFKGEIIIPKVKEKVTEWEI